MSHAPGSAPVSLRGADKLARIPASAKRHY